MEPPPRPAAKADLPAVAKDLADAFAADPHFCWFLRDDARREAARHALFRQMVMKMAWPHARIDRPEGGGAAALWLPSDWLKRPALIEELAAAPVILRATGLARLRRLLALRKTMDAVHPREPHAYLWFLGVSPARQGRGMGSRLLRAGLSRLDDEGLAAYLETGTDRNVALYRRHGFEVIHQAPPAPGAPVMFHMWRKPGADLAAALGEAT